MTDGRTANLAVAYRGILPDLFREGQGVIAEGALDGAGQFKADSVLAKHDEKYMPKEVADALKKEGRWKEEEGGTPATSAPAKSQGGASDREVGHFALVLALALALIQAIVPIFGARLHDPALMNVARSTALAQLLFVRRRSRRW